MYIIIFSFFIRSLSLLFFFFPSLKLCPSLSLLCSALPNSSLISLRLSFSHSHSHSHEQRHLGWASSISVRGCGGWFASKRSAAVAMGYGFKVFWFDFWVLWCGGHGLWFRAFFIWFVSFAVVVGYGFGVFFIWSVSSNLCLCLIMWTCVGFGFFIIYLFVFKELRQVWRWLGRGWVRWWFGFEFFIMGLAVSNEIDGFGWRSLTGVGLQWVVGYNGFSFGSPAWICCCEGFG